MLDRLDHAVLGGAAALLAAYPAWLARSCRDLRLPRRLRLAAAVVLLILAADVQLAVVLLLLGPDGTQDGLLAGDLRVRNLLGVAASVGVWGLLLAVWLRRRGRGSPEPTALVAPGTHAADRPPVQ